MPGDGRRKLVYNTTVKNIQTPLCLGEYFSIKYRHDFFLPSQYIQNTIAHSHVEQSHLKRCHDHPMRVCLSVCAKTPFHPQPKTHRSLTMSAKALIYLPIYMPGTALLNRIQPLFSISNTRNCTIPATCRAEQPSKSTTTTCMFVFVCLSERGSFCHRLKLLSKTSCLRKH
jgi:hypothetical protein